MKKLTAGKTMVELCTVITRSGDVTGTGKAKFSQDPGKEDTGSGADSGFGMSPC
jgi:hypothetical protein